MSLGGEGVGLRGLQEQSSEARTLSLFVGRDEASRAGTWGGGGPGGSGWSGETRSGRSDWPRSAGSMQPS